MMFLPGGPAEYDGSVMGEEAPRYQFDNVEVQPAAFTVLRNGRPVNLEPKAVRVLLYLVEHRDRAVSKEELMQAVWQDTAVTDNSLTRTIAQIRRELGDDARQPRFIETLHTLGYRFVAPVAVTSAPNPPRPAGSRARLIWLCSAAGLLLSILAISGWVDFRHGSPHRSGEPRSLQLTASSGLDIGASLGPDGNSFAYSSNRSGKFEIYKRAVGSARGEVQLTRDGTQNIEPAWSPDGKWIAYHSVAQHGIWLMPSAGGTPRRLTAFGSMPAWSPDSRRIAFSAAELALFAWFGFGGSRLSGIWTVAADGSELRQVTVPNTPRGGHVMPSWSPDGKDLVFVSVLNDSTIWNLNLPSGKLDMLVQVGREVPSPYATRWNLLRDPRFGPAGKGLFFAAMNDKGNYAIYWLRRSGEQAKELYATRGDAPMAIGLSPDGKRLAFTRFLNTSQLWTVGSSTEPRPLFQEAVLRAYRPSFSPDG
jgi:DNA-binding winged helix-turn-helix (wHTH) protein/Tol biopolymer transport system component